MRFHGEYQHTVDAKGRVSLPAKFRKVLPEEVVIVPGVGGALYVYSEEGFDEWMSSFFRKEDGSDGFNPRSSRDVALQRKLSSSAENVTVDAAGRVILSASKRKAAHITKDVYVIGVVDHVEIWDAERYAETMESFSLDDFMEA